MKTMVLSPMRRFGDFFLKLLVGGDFFLGELF
jgi:hypothetical protein